MQYKLLIEANVTALNIAVNAWLENGWVLYGNPTISPATSVSEARYLQAVVRQVP